MWWGTFKPAEGFLLDENTNEKRNEGGNYQEDERLILHSLCNT